MNKPLRVVASTVWALVFTAGAVLTTVITLLFAGGDAVGRRLGFFDSVFVNIRRSTDGALIVGAGLADPFPLALCAAALLLSVLIALSVRHNRKPLAT